MGALQPQGQPRTAHSGAPPTTARMHIYVALALAVFTLAAFGLALSGALPVGVLIPVILVFAVVQVALQVLYYMHLRWDSRVFAGFFLGALCLAVLIALVVRVLIRL